MCETNLDDSTDSGNFAVWGYLPLIRKDHITHMHGCERRISFCTGVISRKLCGFLLIFWTGFNSLSVLLFSPSIDHLLPLYAWFLILFHLTDEVLTISPSAIVFVFGDFNVHHRDWLTYSSETDRPGELCYNFSISNDVSEMVNFPTRIPDCDSHSPALLNLFLIMLLSQFPLTFFFFLIGIHSMQG